MAEQLHPFRMIGPYGLVDAPKPINFSEARAVYIMLPNGKLFGYEPPQDYVRSVPRDKDGNPDHSRAVIDKLPGRPGKVFNEQNAENLCIEKMTDHVRTTDDGRVSYRRVRLGDEWYHPSLDPDIVQGQVVEKPRPLRAPAPDGDPKILPFANDMTTEAESLLPTKAPAAVEAPPKAPPARKTTKAPRATEAKATAKAATRSRK